MNPSSASPSLRPFAERAASLEASATLEMFARVKQLVRQGVEILDLTAGEPDFSPPACAEEAGIQAIREGAGRYTPASGLLELREAVAEQLARDHGLSYHPSRIVVTNGAKIAIAQALMVMVEAGARGAIASIASVVKASPAHAHRFFMEVVERLGDPSTRRLGDAVLGTKQKLGGGAYQGMALIGDPALDVGDLFDQ